MWNFLPWWLLRKAVDTGSSLLDGLVSYWPLDEISGVRYDAVGSNDLTDNNTVGAKLRGPEGTVAKTVYANSEWLGKVLTLDYSQGVTCSIWYRQETGANAQGRYVNHGGAYYYGGTGGFFLTDGNSNPNIYFSVGDNASFSTATTQGNWFDAWHHVVCWYDPSDKKAKFRIDGGTVNVGATALANHPNPAAGIYNEFQISRESVVGVYTDGKFGPTGLWNRLLTTDEQDALFALGNGARYADIDVGASCAGWWEMDEVSGVRYDSHGSNDLTDNNTVGSVNSGPKGVVASLAGANSEYLSKASLAEPGTVWTISGWFKTTDGVNDAIFSFADGASETARLTIQGSVMYFVVDASNTAGDTIVNDLWYHFAAWCDGTKLYLSLNNGVAKEATDSLPAGTDLLTIGKDVSNRHHDGQMGGIGYWSVALSADERLSLFNSGRGKRYADLTDDEKVGLVSYWNLDEQSGVRYDSHGSNDLTDNNTVGSVINAGDAMDGAAASFVAANSESLSRQTIPMDLSTGMTYAAWTRRDQTTQPNMITNGAPTWFGGLGSFGISTQGIGPPYVFVVFANETAYTGAYDTITDELWHLVVAWYDPDTKLASIQIDGRATVVAGVALVGAHPVINSAGLMKINSATTWAEAGDATQQMQDEVAIWDRVLTSDERAELYNLGRGKFYDFS